jgi:ATP-binding protein involved in chromosome partitioning
VFGNNKQIEQVITCLTDNDKTRVIKKLAKDNAISIDVDSASITIKLPFYAPSWLAELQELSELQLSKILGKKITWQVEHNIAAMQSDSGKLAMTNIKNIIVVASGKGGVGKSTVSVNLALALSENGAKVGMLDADMYGPSIPTMLGVKDITPSSKDGKLMAPIESHGIVCNSIGFLVKEADAMIWRGPMASKALEQVLNETDWPELDYLVVDMPPGTGDIQLTMSQSVPVTTAVIVTTPQDIALIDAKKGITMFNKVAINVAGVIENMSYYQCSQCGHQEAIFGTGGGKKLAAQFDLSFLGALPLHIAYREDTDQGQPTVIKNTAPELVAPYLALAENVAIHLYRDLNQGVEQIHVTEVK